MLLLLLLSLVLATARAAAWGGAAALGDVQQQVVAVGRALEPSPGVYAGLDAAGAADASGVAAALAWTGFLVDVAVAREKSAAARGDEAEAAAAAANRDTLRAVLERLHVASGEDADVANAVLAAAPLLTFDVAAALGAYAWDSGRDGGDWMPAAVLLEAALYAAFDEGNAEAVAASDMAPVYNMVRVAYAALGEYDKAFQACKELVDIVGEESEMGREAMHAMRHYRLRANSDPDRIYSLAELLDGYHVDYPPHERRVRDLEHELEEAHARKWGDDVVAEIEHELAMARLPPIDRLVVLTVATEWDIGLELLNTTCARQGLTLKVLGMGEPFAGYGFKIKTLQRELRSSLGEYDYFLFVDAFDVLVAADLDELVTKFNSFNAGLVVSAEANCWPDASLCAHFPATHTRYKGLNTGAMMGRPAYMLQLMDLMDLEGKPMCIDDQHEFALLYAYDPTAFVVDHECHLFQSVYDAEADLLPLTRPRNRLTGSTPALFHVNGYDKTPLVRILIMMNWFQTDYQSNQLLAMLHGLRSETESRDRVVPRCYNESSTYAEAVYASSATYRFSASAVPITVLGADAGDTYGPDDVRVMAGMLRKGGDAEEEADSADSPVGTSYEAKQQLILTQLRDMVRAVAPRVLPGELQEYRGYCAPVNDCRISPQRPDCFDFERCRGSDFLVYVYPYDRDELSEPYAELLDIIVNSPYYTRFPEDACLLVPSVDTFCTWETCLVTFDWASRPTMDQQTTSMSIEHRLQQLPHWDGGRNHLIFQTHESPCVPFRIGAATLVKADISYFHYRPDMDISLPYLALRTFEDAAAARRAQVEELGEGEPERDVLLFFKGARTMPMQQLRLSLRPLHDPANGVYILQACRLFGHTDEQCRADEEEYLMYDYESAMVRSVFGLVVEGFGYNSYRLVEVLAAGAIPVIAVDWMVLPFSEFLDWADFAVLLREDQLPDTVDILRAIPPDEVARKQALVRDVYRRFFVSYQAHAFTAFEIMRLRAARRPASELKRLPAILHRDSNDLAASYLGQELYWPWS